MSPLTHHYFSQWMRATLLKKLISCDMAMNGKTVNVLEIPRKPTQRRCCICFVEHPQSAPGKFRLQILQDQGESPPFTPVYQKRPGNGANESRSNVPVEVGFHLIAMNLSVAAIHAVSLGSWACWRPPCSENGTKGNQAAPCAYAPHLDHLMMGVARQS